MIRLDLVFAPALRPVFGAADMPSSKLERLAERAGLPGNIVDEPHGYVPLHATELFLELVQRENGQNNFLFDSLSMDPTERAQTHSVAGVPLPTGITNRESLEAMTRVFNGFITGARFSCEIRGQQVWVLRTTSATDWSDRWSVLQYNLSIMLSGARRILAPGLQPVALRLPIALRSGDLPENLKDLPVEPDTDHFGLAFDLGTIIRADVALSSPVAGHGTPEARQPEQALKACITKFLASSPVDISARRVAAAFGMSERSYRRKLAAFGTSHSDLLSHARLDIARRMLAVPEYNVTDVAYETGYGNPGDFTRFFKRRMGCTPQDYKRLHS